MNVFASRIVGPLPPAVGFLVSVVNTLSARIACVALVRAAPPASSRQIDLCNRHGTQFVQGRLDEGQTVNHRTSVRLSAVRHQIVTGSCIVMHLNRAPVRKQAALSSMQMTKH
ncbi:hypothetical protein SODALDRAFT_377046 [Sodiomyces alkalinus F11]|uniref:Uncharacterized protein n=1 Tax=Sodiomyces alkalinus (strain CBS 110278 / VKM F-3762 / F11) TaxID=1314773 RepID=A0A3N2Q411_SODAK|nr:hypothetical protein SODALDRAFT_377046 [Sodiomyces alkalinus F11]ROT41365.1 hypothetical protein SODALDRAFT_377046 [Sodiomyces alkalinus F11]